MAKKKESVIKRIKLKRTRKKEKIKETPGEKIKFDVKQITRGISRWRVPFCPVCKRTMGEKAIRIKAGDPFPKGKINLWEKAVDFDINKGFGVVMESLGSDSIRRILKEAKIAMPPKPIKPKRPVRPFKPEKPVKPRTKSKEEIKRYEKEMKRYNEELRLYEEAYNKYCKELSVYESKMANYIKEVERYRETIIRRAKELGIKDFSMTVGADGKVFRKKLVTGLLRPVTKEVNGEKVAVNYDIDDDVEGYRPLIAKAMINSTKGWLTKKWFTKDEALELTNNVISTFFTTYKISRRDRESILSSHVR